MIMKILETNDYSIFKRLPGNREIKKTAVNKLALEIQRDNRLQYHPIEVNTAMEVIDGQTRLTVAEKLKLSIYYIINPDATIETAMHDNTFQQKWRREDYLNSYIERNFPNYVELKDFMDTYDLTINNAVLIGTNTYSFSVRVMTDFNLGKFAFKDKAVAENIASLVQALRPYTVFTYGIHREFLRAVSLIYDKVDQKKLIKKCEVYHAKIDKELNAKGYVSELELIYNRGMHEGNEVRLW